MVLVPLSKGLQYGSALLVLVGNETTTIVSLVHGLVDLHNQSFNCTLIDSQCTAESSSGSFHDGDTAV